MSEEDSAAIDRSVDEPEKLSTRRWVRRGVMIFVAIAAAFILNKAAASFLPRWWAQHVADQVGGSFTAGTMWGLFYGFVFTFIPILLIFQIRRRFLNWKAKVVVAVVAVALAAPNWMTLWVVTGDSNAAHAAERTFDVDVTGFRWATVIGVGMGGLLSILLSSMGMRISHRRKQVKELKEQVENQKHEEPDQSP